jgi:hypothetical protein
MVLSVDTASKLFRQKTGRNIIILSLIFRNLRKNSSIWAHFALSRRKKLEKEGEFCSDMRRGLVQWQKGRLQLIGPFTTKY